MLIAPKRLKIRTSNLTYVFPGTVRTWHPQIFPKRGVFKNLLGGDMHSHECLLVNKSNNISIVVDIFLLFVINVHQRRVTSSSSIISHSTEYQERRLCCWSVAHRSSCEISETSGRRGRQTDLQCQRNTFRTQPLTTIKSSHCQSVRYSTCLTNENLWLYLKWNYIQSFHAVAKQQLTFLDRARTTLCSSVIKIRLQQHEYNLSLRQSSQSINEVTWLQSHDLWLYSQTHSNFRFYVLIKTLFTHQHCDTVNQYAC